MNNSYAFNTYLTSTAKQAGKENSNPQRWHEFRSIRKPSLRLLAGDIAYNCYDGSTDGSRVEIWQQKVLSRTRHRLSRKKSVILFWQKNQAAFS